MATATTDIDLGRGLYAASEIERYVAVFLDASVARRSQKWLREVVRPVAHAAGRPDYSFNDLVSVFAIAELRRHEVPLQRIRQAKERLVQCVGVEQPLALRGLYTDGEEVFADLGVSGQLTNLNRGGQEGVWEALALKLSRVTFEEGRAMQDRPATAWSPVDGVCVDPGVQFGAPCVKGRRIPTRSLWDLAEAGAGVADLAFEFGISGAEVRQALSFEQQLAAVQR